jgi:hypothetical protein
LHGRHAALFRFGDCHELLSTAAIAVAHVEVVPHEMQEWLVVDEWLVMDAWLVIEELRVVVTPVGGVVAEVALGGTTSAVPSTMSSGSPRRFARAAA